MRRRAVRRAAQEAHLRAVMEHERATLESLRRRRRRRDDDDDATIVYRHRRFGSDDEEYF